MSTNEKNGSTELPTALPFCVRNAINKDFDSAVLLAYRPISFFDGKKGKDSFIGTVFRAGQGFS